MILTDKGNRKKPEVTPVKKSSTLEELKERIPKRTYKPGREAVLEEGCDCGLELHEEVAEGTQQEIWFFQNPLNHENLCLYRVLCKA